MKQMDEKAQEKLQEVMQELSSKEAVVSSHEIRDILAKWQEVSDFVEKRWPKN